MSRVHERVNLWIMRVMLGKAGLYVMTKGTVSVCRLGLVLRASLRETSEARCIWVLRKSSL